MFFFHLESRKENDLCYIQCLFTCQIAFCKWWDWQAVGHVTFPKETFLSTSFKMAERSQSYIKECSLDSLMVCHMTVPESWSVTSWRQHRNILRFQSLDRLIERTGEDFNISYFVHSEIVVKNMKGNERQPSFSCLDFANNHHLTRTRDIMVGMTPSASRCL